MLQKRSRSTFAAQTKFPLIMKRGFLLSALITISILGFGQSDFTQIDQHSKTVPEGLAGYSKIGDYLTKDLQTDTEKARALYIWIAHNIQYDLTRLNSGKRYDSKEEFITEALENRKGVCQHYAELFLAMSNSIGLKSYLIVGYTRNALGQVADLSHAWNGIKIDSNYYLIDITWAAGYEFNGQYVHEFRDDYFLVSPQTFIKDHMPFDPMWQFIDNPINNDDFISNDFTKINAAGGFSYADSIDHYEGFDELKRLENSNRRTMENGVRTSLIQNEVDENILRITRIKFNLAVEAFNQGIDAYNLYLVHKNRGFRNPKLDDARVKELIDDGNSFYRSNEILVGLYSSDNELNKEIADTRNRMPDLISSLEREKEFVQRYLRTWKPLRMMVFFAERT